MLAVLRKGRGRRGRPPFLRLWDCTRVPPYLSWKFLGNDMVRLHPPRKRRAVARPSSGNGRRRLLLSPSQGISPARGAISPRPRRLARTIFFPSQYAFVLVY